jgi:hypothetical protein
MTFVYHPLNLDEYKKIRQIDPDGFYPAGPPKYCVFDVERDIKLAHLGGRGDMPASNDLMPDFYVMVWRQYKLRFESRYVVGRDGNLSTINEDVFSVYASKELASEEDAIRTTIPEAIEARWRVREAQFPSAWQIAKINVNISTINFVPQGASS